jgi:hypothetical protein
MAREFHYIYKLTDINTNEFYYGSRIRGPYKKNKISYE